MGKWKLNVEKWTSISIDTAKFLYDESTDYLKYTINLSEKITQRAYTLSLIIIASIGGLIGRLFTTNMETCFEYALFVLIIISVIALFALGILLTKLIFPYDLEQLGRQPKEINDEKYIAPPGLNKEQAYLSFVINEIQNNQSKIDFNIQVNSKRLRTLRVLIILLLVLFLFFVLAYWIIFILFR